MITWLDAGYTVVADTIGLQAVLTEGSISGGGLSTRGVAADDECNLFTGTVTDDDYNGNVPVTFTAYASLGGPDYLDLDSDADGTIDVAESGVTFTGIIGVNGLDNGAETNDDYSDVNANAYSGSIFLLPDTDNDVADDGSDASPTFKDFDWRDNPNDAAPG